MNTEKIIIARYLLDKLQENLDDVAEDLSCRKYDQKEMTVELGHQILKDLQMVMDQLHDFAWQDVYEIEKIVSEIAPENDEQ